MISFITSLILLTLPWTQAEKEALPPAVPEEDYTPVVVPNGCKAPYTLDDGVKVFHLVAEPITWELAKGLTIQTWGYNGTFPGPLIEVGAGDRVRIFATNKLPDATSIHWHGVLLPCGMDGVAGVTQAPIPPGETWVYEFYFPDPGTFMYHPHHDDMVQEGLGLIGMIVVHKREPDKTKRPDRDFVILLHEMDVPVGQSRPNVIAMNGFNILTMNGKVMPDTEPLVAKLGDKVWIRYGNLSAMDHHPIHLHGHNFKIIGTDGGWAQDRSVLMPQTTVFVPVGACQVTEFVANNPGDWVFHCHMTHHTMNQMGHDVPNMLGVDMSGVEEKIQKIIPGFMAMGTTGMQDMTKMGMPLPKNSIPMLGYSNRFGNTVFGGMANIFKVRENLKNYDDPGPYDFPSKTLVWKADPAELEKLNSLEQKTLK
jgi:FtsP/CotA-like multicopper oxidase with cupredoxin domain